MREIYATPADAVNVHPTGWVRLPSGVWATKLPLADFSGTEGITMARVNAAFSAWYAERRGWRLGKKRDADELHSVALHIDPVTLVYNQHDLDNMSSEAYCRRHDGEVWNRMVNAGWTGEPTSNFGKGWIDDPNTPPGMACIYGWWRRDGSMIQNRGWKHDAGRADNVGGEHDYATGVYLYSDVDPTDASSMV